MVTLNCQCGVCQSHHDPNPCVHMCRKYQTIRTPSVYKQRSCPALSDRWLLTEQCRAHSCFPSPGWPNCANTCVIYVWWCSSLYPLQYQVSPLRWLSWTWVPRYYVWSGPPCPCHGTMAGPNSNVCASQPSWCREVASFQQSTRLWMWKMDLLFSKGSKTPPLTRSEWNLQTGLVRDWDCDLCGGDGYVIVNLVIRCFGEARLLSFCLCI